MCYGRSIEVRKIEKLSLEQQKGDRDDRFIEEAAQSRFYFPFLFYNYFGALITGRLMENGCLIGGHLMEV